jgi:hypothetical protein
MVQYFILITLFGYISFVFDVFVLTMLVFLLFGYQIFIIVVRIQEKPYITISETELSLGILYKQKIKIDSIKDILLLDDNLYGKKLIILYETDHFIKVLLRDGFNFTLEEINDKLIEVSGGIEKFDGSLQNDYVKSIASFKYLVLVLNLLQLIVIYFIRDANNLVISSNLFSIIIMAQTLVGITVTFLCYSKKKNSLVPLKLLVTFWLIILILLIVSVFI